VDADIGLRNLDVVLGLENRIVYDIVDVVEGRKLAALIRTNVFPVEFAPAARHVTDLSAKKMVTVCDALRHESTLCDRFPLGSARFRPRSHLQTGAHLDTPGSPPVRQPPIGLSESLASLRRVSSSIAFARQWSSAAKCST
jgi:hypothetical protein